MKNFVKKNFVNNAIVVGCLAKDPFEVKKGDSNETSGHFLRVAINEGKGKDNASFISVYLPGQMSDYRRQKLVKGAHVAIIGELQSSQHKDNNGATSHDVQVHANRIQIGVGGSMTSVTICGNLVADPEICSVNTDKGPRQKMTFRIAYNSEYIKKDTNEPQEIVYYFDVVVWDEATINFIRNYFHKGNSIVVNGQLRSHNYTNKKNQPATSYSIRAEHVTFGFQKNDKNQNSNGNTQPAPQNNAPANTQTQKYSVDDYGIEDDDDLAF